MAGDASPGLAVRSQEAARRPATRPRGIVAIGLIGAFVLVVVAQLIPGSPWEALNGSDNIGRSPIGQRWNLFAPRPPTANLATFIAVRYRDGSGTRVTEPIDLSSAVRHAARSAPWAPPKLVRVVTKLNIAFERHAYREARDAVARRIDTSRALPPALVREIEARREIDLSVYRRLLSAVAPRAVPQGARIVSVRGVVVRTAVNSFDGRDREPVRAVPEIVDEDAPPVFLSSDVLAHVRREPPRASALIFDSGWMDHDAAVEPFKVALP